MSTRPYANVWQKMLLEEQEENERLEANARDQQMIEDYDRMLQGAAADRQRNAGTKLDYNIGALPDFGGVTQPPPRLPYDLDLYEPLAGPGDDRVDDIVVNGRRGLRQRGTAGAYCDGVVMPGMTGWQNPEIHHGRGAGMGWRTWIRCSDGSRIGYGHLDPSSTLPQGTRVQQGDSIGRYGDPTNGRSTNPHLHVQAFDRNDRLVQPPGDDPFGGRGRRLRRFGERDAMHRGVRYPNGHEGDDWIEE